MDLQSELQFQGRATDLSLYGCGVAVVNAPRWNQVENQNHDQGKDVLRCGKDRPTPRAEGDIGIVFARVEPSDQIAFWKSGLANSATLKITEKSIYRVCCMRDGIDK